MTGVEARTVVPAAMADARAATGGRPPRRRAWRAAAGGAAKYGLLLAGAALMVLPFVDMFVGALRAPSDVYANPPRYLPADPQWGVYARVFDELPMWRWTANSLLVTITITLVQLVTSTMAGYALARYEFPGRASVFRLVVGAQMFPFFLLIIPTFFILRFAPLAGGNDWLGQGGAGLLGTFAALVLPFAVTWYGVFLMRQFFATIPEELIEAARLDGASEWLVFRRIALPLVRPALATLALFSFVYHWNEFLWTMTVTRSAPHLQTLPVGIFLLENAFNDLDQKALQQAALAVSVLPVLAIFLLSGRVFASATRWTAEK